MNMNIRILLSACCVSALASCAVNLPPSPPDNPADPHAPEAATRPLRPTLVANSRTFLSPKADDREEKAKQMDMSKMKPGESGMQHDMKGMQHGSMQGMSPDPKATSPSPNDAQSVPMESYYTCPMHPQVKEAKSGQCPICGMTLVKKESKP